MLNQTLNIDNPKKYPISISYLKSMDTVSIERPLSNAKSGFYIMEIWKDIKGYEGHYQISNIGRIKSLKRGKNRILKTPPNSKGYLLVGLTKNGITETKRIQRLVAICFIPNPYNKPEVNHKNGIKIDNRTENLEWATRQENVIHAVKNGLSHAKINYKIAKEIRELYTTKNYSHAKIASKYNLCPTSITNIINYKIWKAVVPMNGQLKIL
ncbi:hypothetical protein LCGC14_0537080 [marine sediment metagenome]|uniref:HNH nuclease domain-containing protein n=1 Tax=marine sediment metagenome TaxID=412755 RepID=A0A0F9V255_9ZZZZ